MSELHLRPYWELIEEMALIKGAIHPWQAEQALRVLRLEMAMDLVRWTPGEDGYMILTVFSHNVNKVELHLQLMLRCSILTGANQCSSQHLVYI